MYLQLVSTHASFIITLFFKKKSDIQPIEIEAGVIKIYVYFYIYKIGVLEDPAGSDWVLGCMWSPLFSALSPFLSETSFSWVCFPVSTRGTGSLHALQEADHHKLVLFFC